MFPSVVSRPFLQMALRCDHQKVKIHRYGSYSNNSGYFPRENVIIGRHIQKIVTCFNLFSSQNHIKVGQVFTSAFAVVSRKMALAFVSAAVSHV